MTTQGAFWNHYTIHNAHRAAPDDRPKRSEKRQRTERVTVRLLPSEYDALVEAAHNAHVSIAQLVRNSALKQFTKEAEQ